jgi:hypothetical protein
VPRFAPIKRLRARQARAAANDNSPHSIYAYSSEVENLLRRLHGAGDPARHAQTALDGFKCRVVMAIVAVALVAALAGSAGASAAPGSKVPTLAALQAFGKQWGDYCLSKGSSCCTAPERVSGYREYCTGNDTCKLSAKICTSMLTCDAKQNECKKKTNNSPKCTEDYVKCHDGALKISG